MPAPQKASAAAPAATALHADQAVAAMSAAAIELLVAATSSSSKPRDPYPISGNLATTPPASPSLGLEVPDG